MTTQSLTPLKDAMEAGIKCVGQTSPVTGKHESIVPTQEMVDDETANLPTQEELEADELREANEALFLLTEANAELSYWVEKTPQEITQIIADAPNTFASFKQMIEKNAQSIRVMALFLKLMRDTGRIG